MNVINLTELIHTEADERLFRNPDESIRIKHTDDFPYSRCKRKSAYIYWFMNSTYVIFSYVRKKKCFIILFFSANNNPVSFSITRGLSLLDAPPKKNGPQQLKTDQDLHYTKNSCKRSLALNIFVHTMSIVVNFNREFMRNKLYLPYIEKLASSWRRSSLLRTSYLYIHDPCLTILRWKRVA